MYIFELCAKLYLKYKKKEVFPQMEGKEYEKCDHLFQSLDSEGKYLACIKCGYVIENLNNKNI